MVMLFWFRILQFIPLKKQIVKIKNYNFQGALAFKKVLVIKYLAFKKKHDFLNFI